MKFIAKYLSAALLIGAVVLFALGFHRLDKYTSQSPTLVPYVSQLQASSGVLKLARLNDAGQPTDDGICTVTLVAHVNGGYEALTAAHCIELGNGVFSVYFDRLGEALPATVDYVGDSVKGYDIAFLHIPTNLLLSYIPLGSFNDLKVGDPVAFVGWAGGIALQYFHGYISKIPGLQYGIQPLFNPAAGINWTYDVAVDAGGGAGASGAGLFDIDSGRIVGTLNGYASDDSNDWFFALPVGSEQIKDYRHPFTQESASKATAPCQCGICSPKGHKCIAPTCTSRDRKEDMAIGGSEAPCGPKGGRWTNGIGSAPMPTGDPGGKKGSVLAIGSSQAPCGPKGCKWTNSIGSAPMPTGDPGGKKGSLLAIGSSEAPCGPKGCAG